MFESDKINILYNINLIYICRFYCEFVKGCYGNI